ncbi:MAG: ORF6N domain-containing protein [Burkholderiales bacterium]|nr:ORF6N domain-containing protein [Burkholderiales bacterium]
MKRLNQQVKRNAERFPNDFVFQLSRAERDEVVANCGHLLRLNCFPTRRLRSPAQMRTP